VKDSFACLDLSPSGFAPLFDAHWLFRGGDVGLPPAGTLRWRRIEEEQKLAAWELAWRGSDQSGVRIFRRDLLQDPRAIVFGGFDEDETVRAGGIAYDAADALGLTNVFGSGGQFIHALGSTTPGRAMVCYEAGDDLRAAERGGFQVLGPLRVWVRAAK
jgi:hypothetical protein